NGANTSFVNRIVQEDSAVDTLVTDPVALAAQYEMKSHTKIPLPVNLYKNRKNSRGIDVSNVEELMDIQEAMKQAAQKTWLAKPVITSSDAKKAVTNPSDRRQTIGYVMEAGKEDLQKALTAATSVSFEWDKTPVEMRAAYLEKAADLFEEHYA